MKMRSRSPSCVVLVVALTAPTRTGWSGVETSYNQTFDGIMRLLVPGCPAATATRGPPGTGVHAAVGGSTRHRATGEDASPAASMARPIHLAPTPLSTRLQRS